MSEINLIGGFYKSKTLPWSAQDVVNWLPVKSLSGGTRSPYKLRGAPGLRALFEEVISALTISGDAPDTLIGATYTYSYSAGGGTPPYTFQLISGALPSGLSLSASGVISGTPTTVQASTFVVSVSDSDGQVASLNDSINVASASDLDVYSLLRFDGNFIDETGLSWTQQGGASIDSTNVRFGSGSGNLSGGSGTTSAATLTVPAGSEFNNDGDWTMEFWLFRNSDITQYQPIVHIDSAIEPVSILSLRISLTGGTQNRIYFALSATTGGEIAYDLPLNSFVHMAVVRNRDATVIYANGVEVHRDSSQARAFNAAAIYIGRIDRIFGPSVSFGGRIDEFRFVKGTAIYTSNFTPPSAPFPAP